MKPSAALLIDLENFYRSRVDHFNDAGIRLEDRPSFSEDLRNLVRYAQAIARLPFAVRRAYADFDGFKATPQELMHQGVEPVQVFRLSGKTANKNAADMKLAMDAISLNAAAGPIEHFVLVSGDADFIPVILELKRRGHTVSVIAVTGATNEYIQRFADHFELFETRQAAESAPPRVRTAPAATATPTRDLATVGAALRRLLNNTRPLRFNIVQPRLSKELGYAFDASAFECASTGEFLRKHGSALGIVVRGTLNEQEIDLPNAAPPSANGSGSTKPAPRQAPRPSEPAAKTPGAPAPEPHTPAHYRLLLASGRPDANEARVLIVPWAALVWVCDAVVPALAPPTGSPATSIELLPRIQTLARATGVPDLDRYAALIHAAVRCSLPVPSPDGIYSLHPETTGEQIRRQLLRYVVYVLSRRLSEHRVPGAIRPEAVAAMFDPGPASEVAAAEVLAALAVEQEAAPATPAPPPPAAHVKPAPRADDLHSPASYRKLLQGGGPKGSGETEHMRVHPVPWPSVERVCADAFQLLSPAAGGGPMPRGLFLAKLYAAEQELCVEKYDSHVRRAVALFSLSNALLEVEGRLTLHPEVEDAGDIRWAALGMMMRLLAVRFEEKGAVEPIRAEAFVAAIEAGPLTDQMIPEIARAIEGMYQPADADEPVPAEEAIATGIDAEPAPGMDDAGSPLEPVTAEVEETAPVPEVIDIELVTDEAAAEPPPDDVPGYRLEPVANAEPADWDPFAFDAVLPEVTPPAPAVLPPQSTAHAGTPEADMIDVSALTSAAVASVNGPAVPAAETPAPDARQPASVALPPDDELPLGVHVGDWTTDEDSIFSDPEFGAERVTERLTGSSTRLAPRLPPAIAPVDDDDALFSDPDGGVERITERLTGSSTRLAPRLPPPENPSRVARITPKPLPPPPGPPPSFPSESA